MTKKSIEVEGKTVKEAISLALNQLGVTRDKVNIKVLAEENKGLFGMNGSAMAKVKITLKDDKENNQRP